MPELQRHREEVLMDNLECFVGFQSTVPSKKRKSRSSKEEICCSMCTLVYAAVVSKSVVQIQVYACMCMCFEGRINAVRLI